MRRTITYNSAREFEQAHSFVLSNKQSTELYRAYKENLAVRIEVDELPFGRYLMKLEGVER